MNHDIEGLREHLFETLAALRDKDNPMDVNRAKVIANVAQAVIHSAKVEVDYLRATGGKKGTGFIGDRPELPAPPATQGKGHVPGKGTRAGGRDV